MASKRRGAVKTPESPATMREATPVSHEQIARYAYRLYEERGRVPGHELEDWLAAERALTLERNRGQQ